jgi:replication initiation and membrane attachment protein DnaB
LIGALSLNRLNSKFLSDENEFDMNEVIELEDDFVISRIRWTKSKDFDLNYLLGIFEVQMILLSKMLFH